MGYPVIVGLKFVAVSTKLAWLVGLWRGGSVSLEGNNYISWLSAALLRTFWRRRQGKGAASRKEPKG